MAKNVKVSLGINSIIRSSRRDNQAMLRSFGVRYLTFVQRRMQKLGRSGGGGEWPALSPATIRSRRSGKKGKSRGATILRDTGLLVSSLQPGASGNLFQIKKTSVRVGWDGTSHGGGLTFRELGLIHNTGEGNVPARPILVEPDERTKKALKKVATDHIIRVIKKGQRR